MPRRRLVQVARVSAATSRAIREFERARSHPGLVAQSLHAWSRFVHGPARAIVADLTYTDDWHDADDPVTARYMLRMALAALPGKAARELRTLLEPLDELYLTRSLPVPEHAHIRELLLVEG